MDEPKRQETPDKPASETEYTSRPADPENSDDRFIHEYPDGRRKLVSIDPIDGKVYFIKDL